MEHLNYTLTGVTPLVMHNGHLADPSNEFAQAMKKISGKKNKTEAEYEELGKLEWFGSLYIDNGRPCITGEVMEATLLKGSNKHSKGPQCKAGIICDGTFPLLYDGPTDPEELWEDGRFIRRVGKWVQKNKIMRTLPIFREWSVNVDITFDPLVLNKSQVQQFLKTAGLIVGLLEDRPKFGRFIVE